MKKVVTYIFIIIIFIPSTLFFINKITKVQVDVSLAGYTDAVLMPDFSKNTVLDGSFQKSVAALFEEKIPLRGVMIKTYNTINYYMFGVGKKTIGKHHSVFEPDYLFARLAIGEYDYSVPEKKKKMQKMVMHMDSVNEKLKRINKNLYVYIAPGKPEAYPEDMPQQYVALSEAGSENIVDVFRKEISGTNVPYFICADMLDSLEYPAFYSTGIHWSRTYEQLVSQRILKDLSLISGKNIRNIKITGVEKRNEPYWRDADVYNVLNLWTSPQIEYYRYTVTAEETEDTVPFNVLLVGDSFSEGLKKEIRENLPEDIVYEMNRNMYVKDLKGTRDAIDGNWDNLDWQRYLDCIDFVVVEMVEPELNNYTYGFIDYLDTYLDDYVPQARENYYAFELDGKNAETWNSSLCRGIFEKKNGYAWVGPHCEIVLKSTEISQKGLEIDLKLPKQLFEDDQKLVMDISVNGKVVKTCEFAEKGKEMILISPTEFVPDANDAYVITLQSSKSFNPYERGESMKKRDLAVQLQYIGGIR